MISVRSMLDRFSIEWFHRNAQLIELAKIQKVLFSIQHWIQEAHIFSFYRTISCERRAYNGPHNHKHEPNMTSRQMSALVLVLVSMPHFALFHFPGRIECRSDK